MHWIDWAIMLVPFAAVMALAFHARRYARDVVDFLAAGRVAGRYVISVGDMAAALSVITIVGNSEAFYRTGAALGFWNILTMPVGMCISLCGYCAWRWRASRVLSFGQFIEKRYSRPLRVFCAVLRNISEMMANAIGPAIAANFFIYFLGLPHRVHVVGLELPCFPVLVGLSLTLALAAIWPAGRISLLVTDTFQGLLSYPIFVLIAGYVVFHYAWGTDIEPVLLSRAEGESFVNPFDISKLRDFNLFALGVAVTGLILNKAAWYGNDTTNSGRTPHEQKMAGVLGTWRNGFSGTMISMLGLLVVAVMNHPKFAASGNPSGFSAHETRVMLVNKVAGEAVTDPGVRAEIASRLAEMDPVPANGPLSQLRNNDTPYIDLARECIYRRVPDALREEAAAVARGERDPSPELAAVQGDNARQAQRLRSVYGQMMLPSVVRQVLPRGLVGLFALLMLMLLVSSDDSRVFNAAATWVQDVALPFMRRPPDSRCHISMLRLASVAVAIFFFLAAVFFSQLDYINMFTQIMCAVWLGGAGPIMVFGLYSRFGNSVGAWCSVVFGCGTSVTGLVLQRTWAAWVVPLLSSRGWDKGVFRFFAWLSRPLNPWVDWSFGFNSGESAFEAALQVFREKFFMNSAEIYGLSMVLSVAAYCLGSWIALKLGRRKLFDLDGMLHREPRRTSDARRPSPAVPRIPLLQRLVGIDEEYTLGDKVIAWSVFGYTVFYRLGLTFLAVLLWNLARPWPAKWWSTYYCATALIVPIVTGCVTTVWFMWGGIRDGIRLFRDLEKRVADAGDNGFEA